MISSRCAACKYLRRKCPSDCIFAPYFPSNDPQRFAFVHKIYGASNIGKMLKQLPVNQRSEAANALYLEAQYRVQDPIYGSAGVISSLQQEIQITRQQLAETKAQITFTSVQSSEAESSHYHQQQGLVRVIPNTNTSTSTSTSSNNHIFQELPLSIDHQWLLDPSVAQNP